MSIPSDKIWLFLKLALSLYPDLNIMVPLPYRAPFLKLPSISYTFKFK